MQVINPEILKQVNKSSRIKARLSIEFNRHAATIQRWITENNVSLTTDTALVIISEELELPRKELLGIKSKSPSKKAA